ncbi:MAG: hypothetical protein JO027_05520 [Solirubrobacterales bacterium]|nr:hypothetical protein [Solirubrobacterales bacterium]
MTDELLEQLRARNPAPAPVAPPPIEDVLGRIAAGEGSAGPRWPHWVPPSLAIVITAAVAAVALVSLHRRQPAATPAAHPTRQTGAATATPGPGEAMRGSLHVGLVGFGPGGTGVIAWMQFRTASALHPTSWLARTSDGGRSWSVARRSFSLFANAAFDGSRDGWAQGVDSNRILRFYVTHDGGRSWTPAQSAAGADSADGEVSVADGAVWAVGTGSCAAGGCRWIVMRGAASGDRLPATAVQPLPPTNQNATTISASSATTAYVASPGEHGTVIYATRDSGQHWRQIPSQCSGGSSEFGLGAPGTDTLWRVCVLSKQFFVERSTDGGARWSAKRLPFIPLFAFEPVSSLVAWSQDIRGTIYRTADGGASWQPVWTTGGAHGRPIAGFSPILSARSRDDASVLVQLTRGPISRDEIPRSTNLVVYRTSDGGRSWNPSIVKLPAG